MNYANRSFRQVGFLLLVAIVLLMNSSSYAGEWRRKTYSPYKSDPPGTYTEQRSDGTTHYYEGGVRKKYEDKNGVVHKVTPPTSYEVDSQGQVWKVQEQGVNRYGNKQSSRTKVDEMTPDKTIIKRDSSGEVQEVINEYDTKRYIDEDKRYLDEN
ncbi:hypothetical protein ACFL38_00115 [Candidatus Omnitrophota bacterium]